MKRTLLITSVAAICAAGSLSAHAGSYCEDQYNDATGRAKGAFVARLDATAAQIKRVQDAGLDPNKYVEEFEGKLVPLTYKYSVIYDRLKSEVDKASGELTGCAKAVAPAQSIIDIATLPLGIILPERMVHIDAGEILNGYPLGSSSAFIPKAREDILRMITGHDNDNGEVSKIIRDPIKCTIGRLFGQCN
jgi:hypothetical protein